MTLLAVPSPPRAKLVPAHLAHDVGRQTDVLVWTKRTFPGMLWSVAVDEPGAGLRLLGAGQERGHKPALEQVNRVLRGTQVKDAVLHMQGAGLSPSISNANRLSYSSLHLPHGARARDPYEAGDYRPELLEFAEKSCPGMITGSNIRIATDGSVSHFSGHAGFGWISSQGQFGVGVLGVNHDIVNAELAAIDNAMSRVRGASGVVQVDSASAISMIEQRLHMDRRPAFTKSQSARLNSLDRSPIRGMRIEKVKAHSGHILNEGADRISRLARRSSEDGIDTRTMWEIAAGVRDDIMDQLAQQQGGITAH